MQNLILCLGENQNSRNYQHQYKYADDSSPVADHSEFPGRSGPSPWPFHGKHLPLSDKTAVKNLLYLTGDILLAGIIYDEVGTL